MIMLVRKLFCPTASGIFDHPARRVSEAKGLAKYPVITLDIKFYKIYKLFSKKIKSKRAKRAKNNIAIEYNHERSGSSKFT